FLLRIFVGFTGKSNELETYKGEPVIATAYRLKFVGPTQQPYDGLSSNGHLAVQRRPSMGYSLVGKQKSQFWQINEQGFRDDTPVPLAKPSNEVRIFILGNSAAFGQWLPNNQGTIANKLETRLNARIAQQRKSPEKYRPTTLPFYKPDLQKALALPLRLRDGQYRVINAAVPGYVSGNQLAQLALQILPYNPDVIVILDGYTDLMLPSDRTQTEIPSIEAFLNNALGHFWTALTHKGEQAIANTYLVKATQYWLLHPQPSASQRTLQMTDDQAVSLEKHFATDPSELKRRIERYRNNYKQITRLSAATNIPLVIALQPEITGRGTGEISPQEQAILKELGTSYQQRVQTGYTELAQANAQLQKAFPKNVMALNFYKLYEGFPKQAFSDAIHLTEQANGLLAERLYRKLSALPKLQDRSCQGNCNIKTNKSQVKQQPTLVQPNP
ncbi:MAG TPA: SGNH/GDSL hydrolase family protein, partial [Coleofasciculaceae cyanobacterium]